MQGMTLLDRLANRLGYVRKDSVEQISALVPEAQCRHSHCHTFRASACTSPTQENHNDALVLALALATPANFFDLFSGWSNETANFFPAISYLLREYRFKWPGSYACVIGILSKFVSKFFQCAIKKIRGQS